MGNTSIILDLADKVGGLARTETYKGYHFDIGGHRFFTKNDNIQQLWKEMLGEDFLKVSRLSSIYYNNRFLNYPLSAINTMLHLGLLESILVLISYLKVQCENFIKYRSNIYLTWRPFITVNKMV
jgi:protoporphyrinogen oxidase